MKITPRRIRIGSLLVASTLLVTATACGGSVNSNDNDGDAPGANGGKAKVAYIDGSCTNSWRIQVRAEFEQAAEQDDDIEDSKYVCAQGDLNQAISAIQSAVTQGYNPIVVFSDFGEALLPAVRAAHAKGTVVVPWLVDIGGKEGTDYTAFVHDDLEALGTATADFMAEKMGGKGNMIAIEGPAGNAYDADLNKAIQARLDEVAPDIEWLETVYADWDPAKSAQAASTLLSKYDDITGLITDEGSTVAGIISRWQAAGRPLPVIYSNDLNSSMKMYNDLKPNNPTLAYGFRSARTYGSAIALEVAMKAWRGEDLTDADLIVDSPSYDCETDCADLYAPDMPGSYIPTSKVPADVLKPLLEGN